MPRAYPSTATRILRARELGARSAGTAKHNPYSIDRSGWPLWRAFDYGRLWDFNGADLAMALAHRTDFPVVDLTSGFRSLCVLLDATLPESWPRRAS